MIKTVLKVNGMMCGMCEVHMNDLVRKNFNVKKVTSSVKGGETVVISEENPDIPFLKKEIKEIGYEQKSTSKFILWCICRFGTWGESYVRLHCQQYYADYFFPCNFSCQYES